MESVCRFDVGGVCFSSKQPCGIDIKCGAVGECGFVRLPESVAMVGIMPYAKRLAIGNFSDGVSRDPDDMENIVPGERVVDSFDFDNREDGK
jgi:hypothetical protein